MFEIRKNLDLRKILVNPKIFLKNQDSTVQSLVRADTIVEVSCFHPDEKDIWPQNSDHIDKEI